MPKDPAYRDPSRPHDPSHSESEPQECRTSPLVPNFSICLKGDRLCPHALSFGHQYLCRHPDHAKFAVPSCRLQPE